MSENKNDYNAALFKTFFHKKPATMLVALKNCKNSVYASHLAKQVDCTYSHVVKILHDMEREGLVRSALHGRLKLLTLTRRGNEVASRIEEIQKML